MDARRKAPSQSTAAPGNVYEASKSTITRSGVSVLVLLSLEEPCIVIVNIVLHDNSDYSY